MKRVTLAIALGCALVAPLRAADQADKPSTFDPKVARRITPEEVQKRRDAGEKAIILDTRGSTGDTVIKDAVHVPNDRLDAWAKDVPKDALIVTYCTWHAEATSARAVLQLQDLGFKNAYALLGGLDAWQSAKMPTAPTAPATP